jgi:hypothetical protein
MIKDNNNIFINLVNSTHKLIIPKILMNNNIINKYEKFKSNLTRERHNHTWRKIWEKHGKIQQLKGDKPSWELMEYLGKRDWITL